MGLNGGWEARGGKRRLTLEVVYLFDPNYRPTTARLKRPRDSFHNSDFSLVNVTR